MISEDQRVIEVYLEEGLKKKISLIYLQLFRDTIFPDKLITLRRLLEYFEHLFPPRSILITLTMPLQKIYGQGNVGMPLWRPPENSKCMRDEMIHLKQNAEYLYFGYLMM